jgi:hypothetical protein
MAHNVQTEVIFFIKFICSRMIHNVAHEAFMVPCIVTIMYDLHILYVAYI